MKNQTTIFGVILITLTFLISCNENNSVKKNETPKIENEFPVELLNKPLYVSPYFVCRDNVLIDANLNFTYSIYSIGTMATANKAIIKGKLNTDGSITFTSSNQYYFSEDSKPTEILPKWDINNLCYGNAKCISLYSKIFNTMTGNYQENNIGFSTEKCTPGY